MSVFVVCCVYIVIILVTLIITGLLSYMLCILANKTGTFLYGWLISSVCFAFCLTILLYQNGVI